MIFVCVASRDGVIQSDVLVATNNATIHAAAANVQVELSIAKYPYGVAMCRNRGVLEFLQRDRFDRILFIDDDVVIPEHAITALAGVDADIALGCYGTVRLNPATGSFKTEVLIRPKGKDWITSWFDGVIDADCGGGGCMMIRRHVFERIGFPWFQWPEQLTATDIVMQSDDGNFCDRALAAGLSIKAHGGVRCGHLKTINVSRLVGVVDGA